MGLGDVPPNLEGRLPTVARGPLVAEGGGISLCRAGRRPLVRGPPVVGVRYGLLSGSSPGPRLAFESPRA
eukprot:3456981-Pyramimonas_sp.AAC.1